ncbi:MAG: response regulator [Candidatus Hydrogenedentes bacterium]|nr:response regulator [Candidatus Hydrogenedentota bacterium]
MAPANSGYILVVDDAAFMRRMIAGIVRALGYDVLDAPDGANAIKTMKQDPPSLVVLDLLMPQMSGFEVCEWIRSNPATAHIPVIVCTADQERKHLALAIKAGASDILCKPVTKASLQERLNKHLHSTGASS